MSTELLGATHEISFIDVIMRDEVCLIRMADLSGADMAQFRNRMKLQGYAPSTIVRRLNLIARAIKVARLEWEINILTNPADATQCARPRGADRKRDRILFAGTYAKSEVVVAVGQGIEGEILPPLADRDDFVKGEQERLFEEIARFSRRLSRILGSLRRFGWRLPLPCGKGRSARLNGRMSTSCGERLLFSVQSAGTGTGVPRIAQCGLSRCSTTLTRFCR